MKRTISVSPESNYLVWYDNKVKEERKKLLQDTFIRGR